MSDQAQTPSAPENSPESRFYYDRPAWKRYYQLILIPFLILAILVAGYVLVRLFIAPQEVEAERLVERMEQGSTHARWQAAFAITQYLQPSAAPGKPFDPKSPAHQEKVREVRQYLPRLLDLWADDTDPEPQMKRFLALAFAYLEHPSTVAPLLEAAGGVDEELAVHALASLSHMVDSAPESTLAALQEEGALERLIKAGSSERPSIRNSAVFLMGIVYGESERLGEEQRQAIEARLLAGLDDRASQVQWSAAFGLARAGHAGGAAVIHDLLKREGSFRSADLSLDARNELFLNAVRSAGRVRTPQLIATLREIADASTGEYPPAAINEAKLIVEHLGETPAQEPTVQEDSATD